MESNAVCFVCGSNTLWDSELGDKPLCSECWDAEADESTIPTGHIYSGEFYLGHREVFARANKAYRERNREKVNEYWRKYRIRHREQIQAYCKKSIAKRLLRALVQ